MIPHHPLPSSLPSFLYLLDTSLPDSYHPPHPLSSYHLGGYPILHIGELLHNRFIAIRPLGSGSFASVWLAFDFPHTNYVALKLQRSDEKYAQQAVKEIEIGKHIRREMRREGRQQRQGQIEGKRREGNVVGMVDWFVYEGVGGRGRHYCMVYELMEETLEQVLLRMGRVGEEGLKEIVRQLLGGLVELERWGVIQGDFRTDNVLVRWEDGVGMKEKVERREEERRRVEEKRVERFRGLLGFGIGKSKQHIDAVGSEDQKKLTKCQRKNRKRTSLKKFKFSQHELENLFFPPLPPSSPLPSTLPPFTLKISDFGTSILTTWKTRPLVQSLQYRAPQILLQQFFSPSVDMWSLGCMIYQIATSKPLFPLQISPLLHSITQYQLQRILEIIGEYDRVSVGRGKKGKKYFDGDGKMRKVSREFERRDLRGQLERRGGGLGRRLAGVVYEMLRRVFVSNSEARARPGELLEMEWFHGGEGGNEEEEREYQWRREEKGYVNTWRRRLGNQASEDMKTHLFQEFRNIQEEQTEDIRIADVKLVDRSFTDLGYIGYSDGIDLLSLDSQNLQFLS